MELCFSKCNVNNALNVRYKKQVLYIRKILDSNLESFLGKEVISIPHHRDSATILGIKMDAEKRENIRNV